MTIVELKTTPSYSNFLSQDQICEINTTETRCGLMETRDEWNDEKQTQELFADS